MFFGQNVQVRLNKNISIQNLTFKHQNKFLLSVNFVVFGDNFKILKDNVCY